MTTSQPNADQRHRTGSDIHLPGTEDRDHTRLAGGAVFFTADWLFGHPAVARHRGFPDADAHDAEIIRRHNSVVAPGDQVWCCGDVSAGLPEAEVFARVEQLNGTIHLIAGNSDPVWSGHRRAHRYLPSWLRHFATVQPFARRRINGLDVLLSHFPYRGDRTTVDRYTEFRLPDNGLPLLHGYVQHAWQVRQHQINVGLDQWDLRPVVISTIAALLATLAPVPTTEPVGG